MALQWKDRVLETSTTTGTGDFTLAGAVTGFRTFASVCSTSDTAYYYIEGVDANGIPTGEWETGLGTYSGANKLTRTTVLASSNAGSAVSFSAGTKRVGLTATALTFSDLSTLIEASNAESWAGAVTTKYISPSRAFAAAVPQTATSSTTITLDGQSGLNFAITLAHNTTLANPSNFQVGRSGLIFITQDATGSRTMAFGSNWTFLAGTPTLSTAPAAVDYIAYFVKASGVIIAEFSSTTAATMAASNVVNTPAGNIAATNVQTALNELDTEKVAKAGDTMTGALTIVNSLANHHLIVTNSLTDSTEKYGTVSVKHYTNAEEPALGIAVESGSTTNIVLIGGALGEFNAATQVRVYTAANNTTTGGTECARWDSSGNYLMGAGGAGTVIDSNRLFRLRQYTVATLPTVGTAGRLAAVADALGPTYGVAVTGGGAVNTPTYDDGTNWTCR